MIKGKKVLLIIPARSGSKGLPGKNIMNLNGKPLIGWPIEAAKRSKYVDRVIVSTDDENIGQIAIEMGAEVPFIRPYKLATDTASSIDVIIHSIKFLEGNKEVYDYVVLLEPTSPLTECTDIDSALEILESQRDFADSIVGVSEIESTHPVFDVRIDSQGLIKPFLECGFEQAGRRQDIEPLYFFEGSLYISDTKALLLKEAFYHDKTLPYKVPKWKAFEIDDMVDFVCVEAIMINLRKIKGE